MKIFVVFGSKSDEAVSAPLVNELGKFFDVEYAVISAHRDLEKLQQKMATWQGDAIVAGAGLAAALPGVVAAMTSLPVFGVPVASQFEGLDSLCSIAQMPPGVPVMTAAPARASAIVGFLRQYREWKGDAETVHIVASKAVQETPEYQSEFEKTQMVCKEKGITLTAGAEKSTTAFNVFFDAVDVTPSFGEFGLHVPFMTKDKIAKAESYVSVLKLMDKGGIWLGVNNLRNAVHSVLRLKSRQQRKDNHVLESVQKAKHTMPAVLYQGSVKNVRGEKNKSPFIFEFSDRYSIFDWGQMPDLLNGKGEALAFMGWFFFDYFGKPATWKNWQAPSSVAQSPMLAVLKEEGLKHHSQGLVGHDLRVMPLEREAMSPTRYLSVQAVNVIHPESAVVGGKLVWNYAPYTKKPENCLVPLEVIFRFGVPEGSSLLKRTGDASYCKDIGLESSPKEGDRFATPVVEFSTKLETSDRYLSYKEAQEIAGLSQHEFESLAALARLLALRLKDCFGEIGLELWDGKFEFSFTQKNAKGERGFMLVDTIGPDELRLIGNGGVHFSKEILRSYYRPTAWHAGVEKAKVLAKERGEKDWKKICTDELELVPPLLSPMVKEKAEMIYKGICKALSQKFCSHTVYPDAWALADVAESFQNATKATKKGAA